MFCSVSYFNVIFDLDEVTAGQGGLGERWDDHLLRPLRLLPRLHRRALHLCYRPQVMDGLLGLIAHFLFVGMGDTRVGKSNATKPRLNIYI